VFTGFLGVLTVGLLYGVVRRIQGDAPLALLAAFGLAIYPQAVVYSRFGFSYNLLSPLALLTLLGLWEYANSRRRGLALAAMAVGIGLTSDLMMGTFILPLALVVLIRRWRDLLWCLPLMALPFAIYATVMLLNAPDAFLFDLRFTVLRLNKLSLLDQVANIGLNYTVLISQDFWMLSGVIGLFLLRDFRLRLLALALFLLPIVEMGRTVALYSLSAYYMIPLLPLAALGTAALVRAGVPEVMKRVHTESEETPPPTPPRIQGGESDKRLRGLGIVVVLLVVVSPLATTLALTARKVENGFSTAIDPFLINADDARKVADYVNAHSQPDDLIIASPGVGWQFRANTADFQMSIAAAGVDTPHLPGDIPADRWAFDPAYQNARFVVVDNLWTNWGVPNVPGLSTMLDVVERWPVTFQSGEIRVYENPAKKSRDT